MRGKMSVWLLGEETRWVEGRQGQRGRDEGQGKAEGEEGGGRGCEGRRYDCHQP